MSIRIYKLDGAKGPKGVVLGLLLLGVGAVIVTAGLALLIVVALGGAALGTGFLLYHRLTGKPIPGLPRAAANPGLDPTLEVFAPDAAMAKGELPSAGDRESR
jgi:hypothetical protein